MEFFTELSDRAAEQISGGKNDQWGPPFPGTEQEVPPGLLKNLNEDGKIPPGLDPTEGDLPGNKNGFTDADIGPVPPGWTQP
ncbi:MAG: hypothetical protein QNJ55_27550 [Xenococcus sp. MO_188.B8]|nr:hypothetical protein [Xenococcus sp. MO_188.B8]